MNVQALRLVPGSKLARLAQALASASCARSSPSAEPAHRERAKARICGISLVSSALKTPSSVLWSMNSLSGLRGGYNVSAGGLAPARKRIMRLRQLCAGRARRPRPGGEEAECPRRNPESGEDRAWENIGHSLQPCGETHRAC